MRFFVQSILSKRKANDIYLEIKNNIKNMEAKGYKIPYVEVNLIFGKWHKVVQTLPYSYLEGQQEEIDSCDILYYYIEE